MSNSKPGAVKALKFLGVLAILAIIYVGKTQWYDKREIDVSADIKTVGKVAVPDIEEASLGSNAIKLEFPSNKTSVNGGTQLKHYMMAWQSQNSWN